MLRNLIKDVRGVSAIEFAFVAPVMILFYLGMAELTMGLMAERRSSHAASAIGDLVAQSQALTNADVDDIFEIADELVKPSPVATLKSCVVSIQADANGTAEVRWSRTHRSPTDCPAAGTVSVPANLIAANEGLVMSEVQYVYTSPIAQFLPAPITFKERFYLRPRQSTYVKLKPN
ncbi:MAG TPA: TadE/TadG family type IV pilus assembly protein [Phenylobacterium sp.]|nr:TadE/TadG family type IV pilus assembly protein [Phenylobacterium sp.]